MSRRPGRGRSRRVGSAQLGAVALALLLLAGSGISIITDRALANGGSPAAAGPGAICTLSTTCRGVGPAASAGARRATTAGPLPAPTGALPDGVLATEDLLNDTLNAGATVAPYGTQPDGTAYDPDNGEVYVADSGSNDVSVLSSNLTTIVAQVPVGSEPTNLIFDPAAGGVVVGNWNSGNLSLINSTSNRVVGSYAVDPTKGVLKAGPFGLAYDAADDALFVGVLGYYVVPCYEYNVTELDAATLGVDRQIATPFCSPWSVAYDPASGSLEVDYYDGNEADAYNATSGDLTGEFDSTNLTSDPVVVAADDQLAQLIWDPASGAGNFQIALLAPSSLTVDQTFAVNVSAPGGLALFDGMGYDESADSLIFVLGDELFAVSLATHLAASFWTGLARPPIGGVCLDGLSSGDAGSWLLDADACADSVLSWSAATLTFQATRQLAEIASAIEFDAGADRTYVADAGAGDLGVLNGSTLQPEPSIAVSDGAIALAYVPSQDTTFVLGSAADELQAVPDSGTAVTANLSLYGGPGIGAPGYNQVNGLAYSPVTGDLYVAQLVSPYRGGIIYEDSELNLTVVDPVNDSRVGSIEVTSPSVVPNANAFVGIAMVPGVAEAVVADPFDDYVLGVDLANGSSLWRTALPSASSTVEYDPTTGDVDVAIPSDHEILEVTPTTGSVVRTISVQGDPVATTTDPRNGRLYVALDDRLGAPTAGAVEELNATTGHPWQVLDLPVQAGDAIAYLNGTGSIAVSGAGASSVYLLGQAVTAFANVTPVHPIQGLPFDLTASASYGLPPYRLNESGLPGCHDVINASGPTLACVVLTAGVYAVQVTVSDAADGTAQISLSVSVAPYPLAVSISGAGTADVGSTADYSVVWSAGEAAVAANTTVLSWAVAPSSAATINESSGPAVRLNFLSAGSLTLFLNASFNGTNSSSRLNISVESLGTAGPGSSSSPGPDWLEIGAIAGVVLVIAAIAVLFVRRRRASRSGGEP